MMRYRLRTLLIVLALGPPVLAGAWLSYGKWRAELERREALERLIPDGGTVYGGLVYPQPAPP